MGKSLDMVVREETRLGEVSARNEFKERVVWYGKSGAPPSTGISQGLVTTHWICSFRPLFLNFCTNYASLMGLRASFKCERTAVQLVFRMISLRSLEGFKALRWKRSLFQQRGTEIFLVYTGE